MRSALILAFLLGSASAKGYNRSRTKLAIPKQVVRSPPANRGPTARIVGGAPPLAMRAPCVRMWADRRAHHVTVTSSGPLSTRSHAPLLLLRRRSCHAVRAQLGHPVSNGRLYVRRLAHRRAVGHDRCALHRRHRSLTHAGWRAPPRLRVGRQRRARLRRDCGYRREVRASRVQ